MEEQVKNRKLTENIKFCGLRTDVIELMANADLMVLPSLYEGFPVVLVESQAIGLPSLISINISREVDLGIDLIEYENLNKMHNWLNKIKGFNLSLKPPVGYIDLLAKQGFDIKKNSEKLLNLYINMESK
ncbi:glycosyltransferase [Moraxella osloensis]|nr:glycosyltransferase [Moraxella osloensis]MDK1669332.1 glycosyltransferase [Moraxella osloensis]